MGVDGVLVGFDGLEGAAGDPAELVGVEALGLLHQRGFDLLALVVADPGGEVPAGAEDHRACAGETSPSSRAAAVASWPPVSSSRGECDLAGGLVREVVVWRATQASVPVNPASAAVPVLSAAATSFSLTASTRRLIRSSACTAAAQSPAAYGDRRSR